MAERARPRDARLVEHDDTHAMLLLNQALAAQPEAAWVYLARLILGGIQERAGRAESAMQLYRAALAVKPETKPADYGPNQTIAVWPYFDFTDKRWSFGSKFITLRQDKTKGPTLDSDPILAIAAVEILIANIEEMCLVGCATRTPSLV